MGCGSAVQEKIPASSSDVVATRTATHGFGSDEVVLITRTSIFCPFTQRVAFVLREKKVQYRLHDLGSDTPDWLKATNRAGNAGVPVLFLRGLFVSDSTDIAIKLDQTYPEPSLWSSDSAVKEWLQFINSELQPAFGKTVMGSAPQVQAEEQPKLAAALQKVEEQLASSGGPYLFGDRFTLADVLLAPPLSRLSILHNIRGFDAHERMPKLRALSDAIFARPAWTAVAYDATALLKYLRKAIPRLPPLSSNRLHHQAFRAITTRLVDRVNSLDISDDNAVRRLVAEIDDLVLLADVHAKFEDDIMFPLVESLTKVGQMKEAAEEHLALDKLFEGIEHQKDLLLNSSQREAAHAEIRPLLMTLKDLFWQHCASEEINLPVVQSVDRAKSQEIARQVYEHAATDHQHRVSLTVLQSITLPEAEQYVHAIWEAFKDVKPEVWRAFVSNLENFLNRKLLLELHERLGDIIPDFASAA